MRNRLKKLHRDKEKTNGLIKLTENKLERISEIQDEKQRWSNQIEKEKRSQLESFE